MESAKIILISLAAAIAYGIIHDQVTARVCVEYFTLGHPPVFDTQDPTLLALGWGTLATWWFGLVLGIPLALMAQFGPPPRTSARALVKPVILLMVSTGILAGIAGAIGYALGLTGLAIPLEPVTAKLPPEKHASYLADSFAHAAAYLTGFAGGSLVWVWAWWSRDEPEKVPGSGTFSLDHQSS